LAAVLTPPYLAHRGNAENLVVDHLMPWATCRAVSEPMPAHHTELA